MEQRPPAGAAVFSGGRTEGPNAPGSSPMPIAHAAVGQGGGQRSAGTFGSPALLPPTPRRVQQLLPGPSLRQEHVKDARAALQGEYQNASADGASTAERRQRARYGGSLINYRSVNVAPLPGLVPHEPMWPALLPSRYRCNGERHHMPHGSRRAS